jgi:hypothetical protein
VVGVIFAVPWILEDFMWQLRRYLLILSIVFISVAGASAASITIGTGDFYISVGDYDYLPFGYHDRLPRVSFYDVMRDYGTWVSVSPFGRAWRPYVYYDWQPFLYGHWTYTRYGSTWVGYEPWAWVAYHYGNWIWSQYYGWVWLPGYEWHPGRVIWSYSYNTIGWMPAPPIGYNYFCGYLCRERQTFGVGYNQPGYPYGGSYGGYYPFEDYNDYDDFDEYEDYEDFYGHDSYRDDDYDRYDASGRDFYDPYSFGFRYDPYYYSPAYLRIAPRLWVFIPVNYFGSDNYADFYFDVDFVRYLFDRRLIQINRQGLDRAGLERVVRQRVVEQPVEEMQMDTDRQRVRVVVPVNEVEKIRTHANRVVKEMIAPAFVEKRKGFKGEKARNKEVVTRVFQQSPEEVRVQTQTLNDQSVINEARKAREERKVQRQQVGKREIGEIEKADREGKLEPIKRAREKAERKEKPEKAAEPPRSEDRIRPRTDPGTRSEDRPQSDKATKLEQWKKRETEKFNSWKERQSKEFENWKELHKDNPEQIRKAESEFQQRMRRAEEQFQKRTEQEERENRKGR